MTERIDSRVETYQHISHVRANLIACATDLLRRAHEHDNSKLRSPEVEAFDKVTAKLKGLKYGSDEYRASLKELGPAIQHHYSVNDHHPEHFEQDFDPAIAGMNLLNVTEMVCDWMAAVKRMEGGSIFESIEINQKRFGFSDDLKRLIINTVHAIDPEAT